MIVFKPQARWRRFDHPLGGIWFRWGEVIACIALEEGYWHMSISHPRRYPTWEEIKSAWYDLIPGAGTDFEGAMTLPRNIEYVNIQENCFHIHQMRDPEKPPEVIRP